MSYLSKLSLFLQIFPSENFANIFQTLINLNAIFSTSGTYLSFLNLYVVFFSLIYSSSSNEKVNFKIIKHDDLIRENESVYELLRLFCVYIWSKCGNVYGCKLI